MTCPSKEGDVVVGLLIPPAPRYPLHLCWDRFARPAFPSVRPSSPETVVEVSSPVSYRGDLSAASEAGEGFAPVPSITGVSSARISLNVYRPLSGGVHRGVWPLT